MVIVPIITLMNTRLFVSSLHWLASWLITFLVCWFVDWFRGNYVIAVDGKWSEWSAFSECSKTCGKGKKTRTRTCTNPPPSGGGKECKGKNNDTKKCNLGKCPGMDIISFFLNRFHIILVNIKKIIYMVFHILFTCVLHHPQIYYDQATSWPAGLLSQFVEPWVRTPLKADFFPSFNSHYGFIRYILNFHDHPFL